MNPFFLLIIGLILIFLEFYLPGAILGIIGGILVLASLIFFAIQSSSPIYLALYVILTGVSLVLLVKFALWRIPRNKSSFSIYSNKDQEGYTASQFDHSAIGKKGVVLSDLKPGGYILVEGIQHQALSQSGYIVKGSEVLVIDGQEESLIVKPIKKDLKI